MKRCPHCKRSKNRAIQEQLSKREICESVECAFADEIKKAIEDANRIKVIKKTRPIINVEKKPKQLIGIYRKEKFSEPLIMLLKKKLNRVLKARKKITVIKQSRPMINMEKNNE